jgi:hypothetical protein
VLLQLQSEGARYFDSTVHQLPKVAAGDGARRDNVEGGSGGDAGADVCHEDRGRAPAFHGTSASRARAVTAAPTGAPRARATRVAIPLDAHPESAWEFTRGHGILR